MGKSKHESSIDKPDFQLLKAKFRENGFKKHSGKGEDHEKRGGNREKEEKKKKEKKRSWWKWLSSVRGHWSCQEPHSSHEKAEPIITNSLKADDDLKVSSNHTVTDIIEMPIESGEKISEILIKPTKTGIKAMIAQYRGSSVFSERPAGDQRSVSSDFSYEIKNVEKNGENVKEKCEKTDPKRLTWNTEVFENNTDLENKNESYLTSALFIHQDMDKIVESAVFIEPHLPKDYVDSNKFDEISQKSLRINKTGVSYKIIDDKNDQIPKTFKTVSEPTWDERRKILRQRRLQDNINNLLEQFMLLEVEDIINLPLHQNKLKESKKKIEFSRSSFLNKKKSLSRKLSRKVSPEILVNIKPFKEFVSEDYIDIKKSFTELFLKNHILGSKDHTVNKKATEILNKSKTEIVFKSEKVSEENAAPALKCAVSSTKENDHKDVEKDSGGVTETTRSLSSVKEELKSTCNDNCAEQISDFVSSQSDEGFHSVTQCTVLKLYKSFSTLASLVDEEESEREKEKEKEKEKQPSKNSLDEVLETLDDSDHGVIFQKNISQFKKKINVVPRFDVRKSVYSGRMDAVKINPKGAQRVVKSPKFMEPCKIGYGKMKAISSKLTSKKKIGVFRLDYLNLWKHRQRQEKILENIFLQLSDAKTIFRPRIEATRIEARTISFSRTLREVHDILESNNFAIMEVEMPMSFEKNLKNMELLWVGSSETLQWSEKPSVDVKKYVTVAVVLSFQGQDFDGKFCTTENDVGKLGKHILQISKFFPNTSECYYLVQNQLLIDYEQKSKSNSNTLTINQPLSLTSSENSKTKEYKTSVTARENHILKLYESLYQRHFGFVEILSNSLYEYVACIYDCKLFSLDASFKSKSELYGFENNLNVAQSASTFPNMKNSAPAQKKILRSEFVDQLKKRTVDLMNDEKSNSDFCLDGFQILYNNSKESLEDDDETLRMAFATHLIEKNPTSAFFCKTKTFEKGNELRDKDDEKETMKKKKVYFNDEMDILRKLEKKISITLKYKSKSSPKETVRSTEFCCHEHRMRKSFILSKETEKEFCGFKKRSLSFDKDIEIRKTGSGLLESRTPFLIKERSYVRKKSSLGIKNSFKSLILPLELKTPKESESNGGERKKTFLLGKSGTNVKKEVVAALNSIKELNKSKKETAGGHKLMSVVIMLSRK